MRIGISGMEAREKFVIRGGQRSRVLYACCLRHSHSLRKVSYPPGKTRKEGQRGPPSAWSATSPTTGACGTLEIPVDLREKKGKVMRACKNCCCRCPHSFARQLLSFKICTDC